MFNYTGYCDPDLDDLIYALIETTNEGDKEALSHEISRHLNQARPSLMIAGEQNVQAYRHESFTFPHDYCPVQQGLWSEYSLMGAEVVE